MVCIQATAVGAAAGRCTAEGEPANCCCCCCSGGGCICCCCGVCCLCQQLLHQAATASNGREEVAAVADEKQDCQGVIALLLPLQVKQTEEDQLSKRVYVASCTQTPHT